MTSAQEISIDKIKAQGAAAGIALIGEHDVPGRGIFLATHYLTYEGTKGGVKVRMSFGVTEDGKITRTAL